MADLTFADYVSSTLAYMNENRDNPDSNRKIRHDDVKNAINRGRLKMLREIGVGFNRGQTTVDAVAGWITPPTDFFKGGILRYVKAGQTRRLEPVTAQHLDKHSPNWASQTGEPSQFVWNFASSGLKIWLHPQPTATVTSGLIWDYVADLDDLEDSTDTCPVMNAFPELQMTTLQAGALSILYLLEGGEADDQFVKWTQIHDRDVGQIRARINTLFEGRDIIAGRN